MNNKAKQVFAGFLLGLMVSAIGSFVFVMILLPKYSFEKLFFGLVESGLLTKVITLGTLPNAIVFHLLIKKKRDYIAKGVLSVVVSMAVFFAVLKML